MKSKISKFSGPICKQSCPTLILLAWIRLGTPCMLVVDPNDFTVAFKFLCFIFTGLYFQFINSYCSVIYQLLSSIFIVIFITYCICLEV